MASTSSTAPAAVLSAVDSTGWSAQYIGTPPTFTPDSSPATVSVARQGYNTTGAATTHTDLLVITKRVRQPYPNQATLTAATVALSDYIRTTDTIAGVTNNSAEATPKPIANWALPDRYIVGNTLRLEVVAFHCDARGGKQVAAVEFRATDGTTTVTQVVATPTILGHAGDITPVIGYAVNLDISTLSNTTNITANAKVYPHLGGVASVNDSGDYVADGRIFAPQTYRKDTTKAATPTLAVVSSAGNNTTGVLSTDLTTARANRFLNISGVFEKIRTTVAKADGLQILLQAGTHVVSANFVAYAYQDNARVLITRDPAVAKADAIFDCSFSANWRLTTGIGTTFRDLTLTRSGGFALGSNSVVESCTLNNNSNNSTIGVKYWLGVPVTNSATNLMSAGASAVNMIRGVSLVGASLEGWLILGCSVEAPISRGARTSSGAVIGFNKFNKATSMVFELGSGEDVTGCAIVQNVFEWTSATSSMTLRLSGDDVGGNLTHIVMHHNTLVGAGIHGRGNLFYNETNADPRTHKFISAKGNIHVQINTKHDVFHGINDAQPAESPTFIGGWAYLYGVGCAGEFEQYQPNSVTAEIQEYAGLGAVRGTSPTVRGAANNPTFTNEQGYGTNGVLAGAGGGTYTLQAGSPADNIVSNAVLSHDLAGTARPATSDTAGAYVL